MIEITKIHKRFGQTQALSDVSFQVPNGRVTGFVGPNGAGKTTLMRIVMGLDHPDSGTVAIDGIPNDPGPDRQASIAAMLDASWAYGRRRAIDHLWMLAAAQGLPRERAQEALELTGLGSVAKSRVGTFSLGMRQRLGIAASLLGEPRTLLFDEPANGLDPEGVRWIRELVKSLATEGVAVLISSHLLSELSQTADRIVVIARGRIKAEGSMDEFLAEPAVDTLVDATDLSGLREACAAEGAEVIAGDRGIVVRGMDPNEVSRLAEANGIRLTRLEAKTVSLEERYMALTSEHVEYRSTPMSPANQSGGSL